MSKEPDVLSPSLSSLPDELVLSCLARVPRSDHASLSLVSKSFRNLVLSQELYKTRSLIGRTEEKFYLCIQTGYFPNWVRFAENHTINLFRDHFPKYCSLVTLDWGIYVIGGLISEYDEELEVHDKCTSDVWLLDCRSNRWRQVTSMGVARASAAAGVVDGKIYVFGGCMFGGEEFDSTYWGEVFHPKTQTWDTLVPMHDRNELGGNSIHKTFVVDDKVYAVNRSKNCFYYSPREGKWGRKKNKFEIQRDFVAIGKLLCGCDKYGELFWTDSDLEEFEWKQVKGLDPMFEVFSRWEGLCVTKLRNSSANIVVFSMGSMSRNVRRTEFSLERREEEGEVWAKTESSEVVAKVDDCLFDDSFRRKAEVIYSARVDV